MTWTFDEKAAPPPIKVEVDGQGFTLSHHYMDADSRMRVMDAMATGLTSAGIGQVYDADAMTLGFSCGLRVLASHMTDWDGVVDPAGNPVPFKHRNPKTGTDETKALVVLGQVPFPCQVKVMMTQLAMNGVDINEHMADMLTRLLQDTDLAKAIAEEAMAFFRGRVSTDGPCSKNSATGETATPTSDS